MRQKNFNKIILLDLGAGCNIWARPQLGLHCVRSRVCWSSIWPSWASNLSWRLSFDGERPASRVWQVYYFSYLVPWSNAIYVSSNDPVYYEHIRLVFKVVTRSHLYSLFAVPQWWHEHNGAVCERAGYLVYFLFPTCLGVVYIFSKAGLACRLSFLRTCLYSHAVDVSLRVRLEMQFYG